MIKRAVLEKTVEKMDLFCRRNNLTIIVLASMVAYFFSSIGVYLDSIVFADFRPIGWDFQFKFVALMVFLIMFSAGLKISKKDMKSLFKAKKSFSIALFHIFFFSPVVAFIFSMVLRIFSTSDFVNQLSLGLALIAASPCAGAAMYWLIETQGNIPFAAALVTFSGTLSPITMPFLINLLTGLKAKPMIEFWTTSQFLLVTIWLPLALSALLRVIAPVMIERSKAFISLLGTFSVIVVNYVIVAKTSDYLRYGLSVPMLLTALAIVMAYVACNFAFGYFTGKLMGVPRDELVSLSFMGAMRNNTVATAVGSASFADMYPYAIIPPTLAVFHHALAKLMALWLNRQRVNAPADMTSEVIEETSLRKAN